MHGVSSCLSFFTAARGAAAPSSSPCPRAAAGRFWESWLEAMVPCRAEDRRREEPGRERSRIHDSPPELRQERVSLDAPVERRVAQGVAASAPSEQRPWRPSASSSWWRVGAAARASALRKGSKARRSIRSPAVPARTSSTEASARGSGWRHRSGVPRAAGRLECHVRRGRATLRAKAGRRQAYCGRLSVMPAPRTRRLVPRRARSAQANRAPAARGSRPRRAARTGTTPSSKSSADEHRAPPAQTCAAFSPPRARTRAKLGAHLPTTYRGLALTPRLGGVRRAAKHLSARRSARRLEPAPRHSRPRRRACTDRTAMRESRWHDSIFARARAPPFKQPRASSTAARSPPRTWRRASTPCPLGALLE